MCFFGFCPASFLVFGFPLLVRSSCGMCACVCARCDCKRKQQQQEEVHRASVVQLKAMRRRREKFRTHIIGPPVFRCHTTRLCSFLHCIRISIGIGPLHVCSCGVVLCVGIKSTLSFTPHQACPSSRSRVAVPTTHIFASSHTRLSFLPAFVSSRPRVLVCFGLLCFFLCCRSSFLPFSTTTTSQVQLQETSSHTRALPSAPLLQSTVFPLLLLFFVSFSLALLSSVLCFRPVLGWPWFGFCVSCIRA